MSSTSTEMVCVSGDMFMPNELVAKIISLADVPIDTYLAFLKYGAVPKKLKPLDKDIKDKLDKLCKTRARYLKFNKTLSFPYTSPLYENYTFIKMTTGLVVTRNGTVELKLEAYETEHHIDDLDDTGNLVYSFKIIVTDINNQETWSVRKEHYFVHDGMPSEPIYESDIEDE